MSEADKNKPNPDAAAGKPKKRGKLLILIALIVVLIGGGGGGFYYWRVSAAAAADPKSAKNGDKKAHAKAADAEDGGDETPADDGEKPAKKSGKSTAAASLKDSLPNDEDVKHIIELQPFIVNLADADQARYLRLTVNLGVGEAEGTEKPNPLFLNRIRNAMLSVLTTKSSADVLNVEGKNKLRRELLKAAQAASEEPKVEAIYITDFIVQL